MSTPAAEAVTPDQTDPNSTQLYINNLSFSTTTDGLIAFFQQKLSLAPQDVNIVMNKYNGRSKGFGFLRVPKDKVQAACSLSGSILDEREVKVVEAIVRTPEERAAEREARDLKRKETAAKRREERAALAAANPTATLPTSSSPPAERRPRAPRPERKVYENATQLYVSNLSYDVTKEKLKEVVDAAIGAESLEVDIVMRRIGKFKGRSRGYGFVTVPNDKVEKGLGLTGTELEGRAISVVIAKERKPEEEGQGEGGAEAATGADGEEKQGGDAPKRRSRPPRRRGARAGGANGAADPSKDAEAVASATEGTTVASGSSAPTPATTNGQQHKNVNKKPRKPKAAAAAPAAVDVGGSAQ